MRRHVSQDIWVLVVMFLFLVAVGYVASTQNQREAADMQPDYTTYSRRAGGMKGLHDTLRKLDYPVNRHLSMLTDQPADGVFFLIAPGSPLSDAEWETLRDWVERGKLLVVASDHIRPPKSSPTMRSKPACPSFLSPDVESFDVQDTDRLTEDTWEFGEAGCSGKPFG